VLTYTTMLFGLTFSRNTISGNRSFSANLTSTSHSYIHLVLIIHFWPIQGLSKSWLSLYGQAFAREQLHKAFAMQTSTFAKLPDNGFCVKRKGSSFQLFPL
jgi:hypothetical protein